MSYLLGIDLGTTRTSAAVGHPATRPGEIEVVNLGDRASSVPSVFYAGADGTVLVGEAAERRALTEPARVVREFKRRIGDPTPLVVAGVPWSPQELSARVVRWVVDRVAEREGAPAVRVAVTHPASWGPLKKELLGGALASQGLQVSFLAEPQAAALHYASTERLEPGSTIAVYDLGGGTFDAAVVHKARSQHEGNGFGLVGRPEGIERLGGVDFDQAVFDHVRTAMPEAFADLDDTDPSVLAAVAAVRRECSEAKEALSSDTEVSIPVLLPAAQGSVRLHRSEFEAMIRPQIEDTVSAMRRAVASAGLVPEQLTAVLLVGGSSRIPLVAQLVSEQLGRPVSVDADPKNAIAMGAALSLDPVALNGSGAHVPAPRTGGMPPRGPSGTGAQWPGAVAVGAAAGARMSGTAGTAMRPAEPPTQRVAAQTGAFVPPPRAAYPERPQRDADIPVFDYQPDDYDRPEAPRRRSPALFVTAGGIMAAVAVVGAALLLPAQQPQVTATENPSTSVPGLPVRSDEIPTPTPSAETSAPTEDDVTDTVTTDVTRPPVAPPVVPTEPVAPPVTTTTDAPPPTTTDAPPPTTTTTTTPVATDLPSSPLPAPIAGG